VSRGFVLAARVANESFEFDERIVGRIAVLSEDADDTPTTESPAGSALREHFRSFKDSLSADGAMAGAMEESQRTPPSKASTRSQTMVKRPMEPSARSARDLSRFLRDFIGLDDPDNRGTGDMVQQSAAECNEKVKGDRQDNFAAQSGGMMGTSEMTVAPVRKTKNGSQSFAVLLPVILLDGGNTCCAILCSNRNWNRLEQLAKSKCKAECWTHQMVGRVLHGC
jgi:hypothetical protein